MIVVIYMTEFRLRKESTRTEELWAAGIFDESHSVLSENDLHVTLFSACSVAVSLHRCLGFDPELGLVSVYAFPFSLSM